jgi:hypothetical protein
LVQRLVVAGQLADPTVRSCGAYQAMAGLTIIERGWADVTLHAVLVYTCPTLFTWLVTENYAAFGGGYW